jgi:hypothetical protein
LGLQFAAFPQTLAAASYALNSGSVPVARDGTPDPTSALSAAGNKASSVGVSVEQPQIRLNLKSVKLLDTSSSQRAPASLKTVLLESNQNSQLLSTVRIPELKPTKPIGFTRAIAAPSRRAWLMLALTEHGAAAFDAYSTRRAVASGAVEMDPVMRAFAHSPGIYAAIQAGPVVFDLLSRHMQRSENRVLHHTWWLPQTMSIGTSLFAGVHNVQVASRLHAANSNP